MKKILLIILSIIIITGCSLVPGDQAMRLKIS